MEDNQPTRKQRQSNSMTIAGLMLLIVAVVLLALFFMNGETKVSGGFPDPETTISATCTSGAIAYPYFSMDGSVKKDLNIKIISNGDKVDTVSLAYRLYYDTDDMIIYSRDTNHFAMNKAFEAADMEPDSLGATYSKLSDNFRFNIFAKAIKLDNTTKGFFMLDGVKYDDDNGVNYEEAKQAYIKQGFKCVADEPDEKNDDKK